MTDDQIAAVLNPLIMAFSFNDGSADVYGEKLKGLTDFEAATKTTDALIDEHESLRAPAWAIFKKIYDRWHARLEEQREER